MVNMLCINRRHNRFRRRLWKPLEKPTGCLRQPKKNKTSGLLRKNPIPINAGRVNKKKLEVLLYCILSLAKFTHGEFSWIKSSQSKKDSIELEKLALKAFNNLKAILSSSEVLVFQEFSKPFHRTSDATPLEQFPPNRSQ